MKQNDIIHHFIVKSIHFVPELHGTIYRMEYMKNKAQLLWLDNHEENKWFSITFKTLPTDDTGVFHILEHSVLNGSQKYLVKEPFVELLKSSMSTFLNALTFSDKTMFPVSSQNEKDFLNLMQVYLDAVFCPNIYQNPNIFYQEGWHYEFDEENEHLNYNGVVYNEMKGQFSSVDTLLEKDIQKALFPHNCYQYVSGGDPKAIPDLSYEEFLSTHQEYYHPSNAKIYLDGNVPIDQVLKILDEDYLSKFDQQEMKHEIPYQELITHQKIVDYYELDKDESLEKKGYMALGKIACDFKDRQTIMALWILSSYLTGSQDAPLKKEILKRHLAQDIALFVADNIMQPYLSIRIFNMNYQDRDEIKKILFHTIQQVIHQGINKKELQAIINQLEFEMNDIEEPKALSRNINALSSWLYGGDPELYLVNHEQIECLRQKVNSHYYEDLLESLILDEEHLIEFYLLPSYTKGEEDIQKEQEILSKIKETWSHEEKNKIINMNKNLKKWQETPDSPSEMKSIPNLSLKEIDSTYKQIKTELQYINDIPVLFHQVDDSNIIHFHFYYSLADCSLEQLSSLSFLTHLFGMLPTRHYSINDLQCLIKEKIGFIDYNLKTCSVPGQPYQCRPYFVVSCSALKDNLHDAIELIQEIVYETLFDSRESLKDIEDILHQCYEGVRQSLIMEGHIFSTRRSLSHFSATHYINERVEGFEFYCWIKTFMKMFNHQINQFIKDMEFAKENVFQHQKLLMSITFSKIPDEFLQIKNTDHSSFFFKEMVVEMKNDHLFEAIQIPSGVSYTSLSANIYCLGHEYEGTIDVIKTILSYEYLWNEIRVLNGAYGCGLLTGMSGNMSFYSYRDPNPHYSLQVYSQTSQFIHEFCEEVNSIEKYIIRTLSQMQPLQILRVQAEIADIDYLSDISFKDRNDIYHQIFNVQKEDLLRICDLFDRMIDKGAQCMIAPESEIKKLDNKWKIYKL